MEDIQVILYIVFGVLYFIFKVLKGKKDEKQPNAGGLDEYDMPSPPVIKRSANKPLTTHEAKTVERTEKKKPGELSFDDLLNDYKKAAEVAQKRTKEKMKRVEEQIDDEYQPVTEPGYQSYQQEDVKRRIKETEVKKALQEEARAMDRAAAYQAEIKRLEEQEMKLTSMKVDEYRKNQAVNPYAKRINEMLNNKEDVKSAFILSEIFQRKHF